MSKNTMQTVEEDSEKNDVVINSEDTMKRLESLISESLQLYELDNQKANTTDELVNSLRIITEYLGFSVNIHPNLFELPSDSNIIILPNLDIIIRKSSGKTERKRLDQFEPEKITSLLEYITPLFLNMIQKEKTILTEKIAFLRDATSKLKQMKNIKTGKASSSDNIKRGQTAND